MELYLLMGLGVVFAISTAIMMLAFRKKGVESLFIACQNGDIGRVKNLIKGNFSVLDVTDRDGRTPLITALENGQTDIADLLIYKGANVNISGSLGMTPLHMAAERGYTELVTLLIQKGALLKAKDELGATPLQSAVDKGRKDVIKILLTKGADINATDNAGETPMKTAMAKGRTDIIELLRAHAQKE